MSASAIAGAVGTGASAGANSLASLTDLIPNLGFDNIVGGFSPIAEQTGGLWDSVSNGLGATGNFLGSDGFSNAVDLGTKGYSLWQNKQMQDYQKGLMDKQEGRANDAYSRDVEADNRRKNLRF